MEEGDILVGVVNKFDATHTAIHPLKVLTRPIPLFTPLWHRYTPPKGPDATHTAIHPLKVRNQRFPLKKTVLDVAMRPLQALTLAIPPFTPSRCENRYFSRRIQSQTLLCAPSGADSTHTAIHPLKVPLCAPARF